MGVLIRRKAEKEIMSLYYNLKSKRKIIFKKHHIVLRGSSELVQFVKFHL